MLAMLCKVGGVLMTGQAGRLRFGADQPMYGVRSADASATASRHLVCCVSSTPWLLLSVGLAVTLILQHAASAPDLVPSGGCLCRGQGAVQRQKGGRELQRRPAAPPFTLAVYDPPELR